MKNTLLFLFPILIFVLFMLSCGPGTREKHHDDHSKQTATEKNSQTDAFIGHWQETGSNNPDKQEITISKSGDMYLIKEISGGGNWYTAAFDNGVLKGTEKGDITFLKEKDHIIWQEKEWQKLDD